MKLELKIIVSILILVFCKKGIAQVQNADAIHKLWDVMVFENGGCLGGEQYAGENKIKRDPKKLVFSDNDWKKFSSNDKIKITEFLISKLSDTTKTKIHVCPFFEATNGEMAVYSLQHIHDKNWYNFTEFNEYKDREITNATDQPQVWLQKVLKNETTRKKLTELFLKDLKR